MQCNNGVYGYNERIGKCELNSSGLGYDTVYRFCGNDNQTWDFIKYRKYID
jgi:hypothetical protein